MHPQSINQELRSQLVDKWAALTAKEQEQVPRLPIEALLGEASDLVALLEKYFKIQLVGGEEIGLEAVAAQSGVTIKTISEIWELQAAVSEVKSRYVNEAKRQDETVVRADELLSELRSVLSFLLEDGTHPEGATQLSQLREEYDEAHSHDAVALALEGYSELASQNEDAIAALGLVEVGIIDEALRVADALRRRSADRLAGNTDDARQDLMKLRNRLIGALQDKMQNARRTIRFVFRNHPEIADKAASRYFREAKRKSRARGATSDAVTGTEPTRQMPTSGAE